jgi:hypothetical protein
MIRAGDDRVLSKVLPTARGKGSGVDTQGCAWQLFWLADGKIRRRQVFGARVEALEAARLSEYLFGRKAEVKPHHAREHLAARELQHQGR